MSQTAFSVRMDSQLKKDFSLICEDFGMPVSTAFTLFAKAVKSDLPNALTRKTIDEAEQGHILICIRVFTIFILKMS